MRARAIAFYESPIEKLPKGFMPILAEGKAARKCESLFITSVLEMVARRPMFRVLRFKIHRSHDSCLSRHRTQDRRFRLHRSERAGDWRRGGRGALQHLAECHRAWRRECNSYR